jgi:penicillin-binding protein activator
MRAHVLALALLPLVAACSSVDRVDPRTVTDLSGNWNDTDSRLVAEEMITDCLRRPWLGEFRSGHGGSKPVVIVGTIKNRSSEHIPVGMFTKDLEKELLNSGLVRFVAAKGERDEVREEREDQQLNSNAETMKRMRQENGADFMVIGSIDQNDDRAGGKAAKAYQVNLELVDLESNEKVWIGTKDIKKMVKKGGLGL